MKPPQEPVQPTTGVFFHDIFRGRQWDIIGDKFRRFPEALGDTLRMPQVDCTLRRR